MSELQSIIMRDIEDDVTISAKDISVQIESKGFLKKRRLVRLVGTVSSEVEKKKAGQIAVHHAGDAYDVVNELTIK